MKWGGCSSRAGEKANRFLGKLVGNKGIYYLLMIAVLGLLLGASYKWHP